MVKFGNSHSYSGDGARLKVTNYTVLDFKSYTSVISDPCDLTSLARFDSSEEQDELQTLRLGMRSRARCRSNLPTVAQSRARGTAGHSYVRAVLAVQEPRDQHHRRHREACAAESATTRGRVHTATEQTPTGSGEPPLRKYCSGTERCPGNNRYSVNHIQRSL